MEPFTHKIDVGPVYDSSDCGVAFFFYGGPHGGAGLMCPASAIFRRGRPLRPVSLHPTAHRVPRCELHKLQGSSLALHGGTPPLLMHFYLIRLVPAGSTAPVSINFRFGHSPPGALAPEAVLKIATRVGCMVVTLKMAVLAQ